MKVRVDVLGEWAEKNEYFTVEIDDKTLVGCTTGQATAIINQIVGDEFWKKVEENISYSWSIE
jgi:hypothetical protein